ncbi:7082_t:CDS:2, partial [Paraglomus occultum]
KLESLASLDQVYKQNIAIQEEIGRADEEKKPENRTEGSKVEEG